ncbi:MAG: transcription elongation factor GreA [Anaerolineales bacterium]
MSERMLYLTPEGAEKLRVELDELKGPRRDEIAHRLRDAISMGDLSENADYHKAKEDQAFLEGRIKEIDYILQNAKIIENKAGNFSTVEVGASVTIQEAEFPPETYLLVGATEADPRNGRISNESPIGKAIIGKKPGDAVIAQTPAGPISITILKIE